MTRRFFNITISILFAAIVILLFGVINTMVSLKYETDHGCISHATGIDLCQQLINTKIEAFLVGLVIVFMLFLKPRIIRDQPKVD